MSDATLTFEAVLEKAGLIAKWKEEGEVVGEARGEARGKEEGKKSATLDIARNLIELGLPFETIVSATKLDPERVRQLYGA